MRRRHVVRLVAASTTLSAVIPGRSWAQGTRDRIQLAAIPTDALTPLYYGMKAGIFERAGIDLQVIPTSSGTAAVTAVIAGTYEVANSSLISVMAAHLRDVPIAIVAPQAVNTPKSPFALLQAATDTPFRTGADLNGKTIGVLALNDLNTLITKVWVDKNGGDAKTLKFVEFPFSAMEEALVAHRVDAAVLLEPVLDESLAAGRTRTLSDAMAAIAPSFMFAAYIARPDWRRSTPTSSDASNARTLRPRCFATRIRPKPSR